ncbi:MAG: oligosaccharide flippase family protein [Ignavibacteria bacterium]|nr:oligosaccharide flippase family protein [Ignavibacteria bacterium]
MRKKIKTLASDTLVYGIFTVVSRFLTFLLTPLYSNYLTLDEVGDVTYIFSIIAFLNIIYNIGLESAFFRFYKKDDLLLSKKAFSNSYLPIVFSSLLFSSIIFINSEAIARSLPLTTNAIQIIKISAFIPFFDAIAVIPYALLRMVRKVKKFSTLRFLQVVVAVTLNVLFVVVFPLGSKGVMLAQIISNALAVFIFIPELRKYLILKIDKTLLKQMFRFGIPTVPASLSSIILQIADRPILIHLTNSVQGAIYSVNYRLGIPMMMFVGIFEYAWKPFYLSNYEEKDAKQLYARIMTYFSLVCAAIFLLTGFYMDFVVRFPFVGGKFINPDYWEGMGIIPIILAAYFFNGLFTILSAGFHIEKRTDYLPLAVGIAAVLNIGLNFLLIPHIGYWGSAYATLIAYFISAVLLYIFAKKVYYIKYELKRLFLIVFLSAALYFIFIFITSGMELWLSFTLRTVALLLFVVLLKAFGFFTSSEILVIKRFLNFKNRK